MNATQMRKVNAADITVGMVIVADLCIAPFLVGDAEWGIYGSDDPNGFAERRTVTAVEQVRKHGTDEGTNYTVITVMFDTGDVWDFLPTDRVEVEA